VDFYQATGYSQQDLNNRGIVAGSADTSTPDPFAPNCFNADCFVSHTLRWQNGILTDLGALPGGSSSLAAWISGTGLIAGESQNGLVDPMTGLPEFDAVLWKDGRIINLGTLGGTLSAAFAVNNRGQVVGGALNGVPDPFYPSQARAFLWQNGVMQDLGTLGGNDAGAVYLNQRGQVAGWSFTNSTPNPVTGIPTEDPFLWENGTMLDLGTLGGTLGFPNALNEQGEVVGVSNLAGDLTSHPFLWTRSKGIQDLGTFGGSNGQAIWINDAGEIVGSADFPGDQIHHAFLWKRGVITDLGTVGTDPCSREGAINSKGQIVGGSSNCTFFLHAYLWEKRGPMVDLNTLVPPDSDLQLTVAVNINDRGEIIGLGVLSGCSPENVGTCGHAYLLIPCEEDDERCGDTNEGAKIQSTPATVTQSP
jgi:probable HAF family extracellular repeat protein